MASPAVARPTLQLPTTSRADHTTGNAAPPVIAATTDTHPPRSMILSGTVPLAADSSTAPFASDQLTLQDAVSFARAWLQLVGRSGMSRSRSVARTCINLREAKAACAALQSRDSSKPRDGAVIPYMNEVAVMLCFACSGMLTGQAESMRAGDRICGCECPCLTLPSLPLILYLYSHTGAHPVSFREAFLAFSTLSSSPAPSAAAEVSIDASPVTTTASNSSIGLGLAQPTSTALPAPIYAYARQLVLQDGTPDVFAPGAAVVDAVSLHAILLACGVSIHGHEALDAVRKVARWSEDDTQEPTLTYAQARQIWLQRVDAVNELRRQGKRPPRTLSPSSVEERNELTTPGAHSSLSSTSSMHDATQMTVVTSRSFFQSATQVMSSAAAALQKRALVSYVARVCEQADVKHEERLVQVIHDVREYMHEHGDDVADNLTAPVARLPHGALNTTSKPLAAYTKGFSTSQSGQASSNDVSSQLGSGGLFVPSSSSPSAPGSVVVDSLSAISTAGSVAAPPRVRAVARAIERVDAVHASELLEAEQALQASRNAELQSLQAARTRTGAIQQAAAAFGQGTAGVSAAAIQGNEELAQLVLMHTAAKQQALNDDDESIDLAGSALRSVPYAVWSSVAGRAQLARAVTVDLSDNFLSTLPERGVLECMPYVQKLCLDGNSLRRVPEAVAHMKALRILSIRRNAMETLPSSLCTIPALRALLVSGNQLQVLPDTLAACEKLQILNAAQNRLRALPMHDSNGFCALVDLDITSNHIELLPDCLCELPALRRIAVAHNELRLLPHDLGRISTLTELLCSHNRITRVPDSLGMSTALHTLDVSHNRLRMLPRSLQTLAALRTLHASHNSIEAIGDWVGDLVSLQTLDMKFNVLARLPKQLGSLQQLQVLDVRNNQLRMLPVALGACKRLEQLLVSHNNIGSAYDGDTARTALHEIAKPAMQRRSRRASVPSAPLGDACIAAAMHARWDTGADSRALRRGREHGALLVEAPSAATELGTDASKFAHVPIHGTAAQVHAHMQAVAISSPRHLSGEDAESREVSGLPETLAACPCLRFIDASHNFLTDVPDTLGLCSMLQEVDVSFNALHSLPHALMFSPSLHRLRASHNRLSALDTGEADGSFPSLQELDLAQNFITRLPEMLSACASLTRVRLAGNRLMNIPASIGPRMHAFVEFDVSNNPLTELPARMPWRTVRSSDDPDALVGRLGPPGNGAARPSHAAYLYTGSSMEPGAHASQRSAVAMGPLAIDGPVFRAHVDAIGHSAQPAAAVSAPPVHVPHLRLGALPGSGDAVVREGDSWILASTSISAATSLQDAHVQVRTRMSVQHFISLKTRAPSAQRPRSGGSTRPRSRSASRARSATKRPIDDAIAAVPSQNASGGVYWGLQPPGTVRPRRHNSSAATPTCEIAHPRSHPSHDAPHSRNEIIARYAAAENEAAVLHDEPSVALSSIPPMELMLAAYWQHHGVYSESVQERAVMSERVRKAHTAVMQLSALKMEATAIARAVGITPAQVHGLLTYGTLDEDAEHRGDDVLVDAAASMMINEGTSASVDDASDAPALPHMTWGHTHPHASQVAAIGAGMPTDSWLLGASASRIEGGPHGGAPMHPGAAADGSSPRSPRGDTQYRPHASRQTVAQARESADMHGGAAAVRHTNADVAQYAIIISTFVPHADAEWYADGGSYLARHKTAHEFVAAVGHRVARSRAQYHASRVSLTHRSDVPLDVSVQPSWAAGTTSLGVTPSLVSASSAPVHDATAGASSILPPASSMSADGAQLPEADVWHEHSVALMYHYFTRAMREGAPPLFGSLPAAEMVRRKEISEAVARIRAKDAADASLSYKVAAAARAAENAMPGREAASLSTLLCGPGKSVGEVTRSASIMNTRAELAAVSADLAIRERVRALRAEERKSEELAALRIAIARSSMRHAAAIAEKQERAHEAAKADARMYNQYVTTRVACLGRDEAAAARERGFNPDVLCAHGSAGKGARRALYAASLAVLQSPEVLSREARVE